MDIERPPKIGDLVCYRAPLSRKRINWAIITSDPFEHYDSVKDSYKWMVWGFYAIHGQLLKAAVDVLELEVG